MSDPDPASAPPADVASAPPADAASAPPAAAASAAPVDEASLELAVAAARRVNAHLRTTTASSELLAEATAALDALADQLAPFDHDGPYAQSALDAATLAFAVESRDPMALFPYSPIVGRLNPIAPPVEFEVQGNEVVAEHTFEACWTGPPGSVHGGVIALVFDDLLGAATVINGVGGYTGTLEIRYRAQAPIGRPLRFRGWVDRVEGRKIFARGTLSHGDVVCSEAEGIFIVASARAVSGEPGS
jgi:acyl-coenzyme A thioesterase PaaI-like protein